MQNEVTRAVRNRNETGNAEGARVFPISLIAGSAVSLFLLSLIPFSDRIVGGERGWVPLVFAALGSVLFAGHGAIMGGLSGVGHWKMFALLSSSEATTRVILVSGAIALTTTGGRLSAVEAAVALAAGAWLILFVVSRKIRNAASERSDRSSKETASAIFKAMGGGVGNAILLVGFPVLLAITTDSTEYKAAAPFLLAISFTRAPIMLPLNSFQGVIIAQFVSNQRLWKRLLIRYSSVIMAVAGLGAVLAAILGPWLMQVLLGENYRISGETLAWLMIAAGLIAIQTICSALLLALSKQSAYAIGWLLSAMVCIGVLIGPWDLQTRAILALFTGTISGIIMQLIFLNRAIRPLS